MQSKIIMSLSTAYLTGYANYSWIVIDMNVEQKVRFVTIIPPTYKSFGTVEIRLQFFTFIS